MHGSATVNGIELHYRLSGRKDGLVLLLVHPLATDHSIWGYQLPLLGAHFRLLACDLRGHGKSSAPEGAYDLETMADDLAALLDHLTIPRVHFLGLSIGGMIGQAFALKHAHKLDKLILACTMCTLPGESRAIWESRIATVAAEGVAGQWQGTVGRWFSPRFIAEAPATIAWVKRLYCETSAKGFIGSGHAIRRLDFQGRLGAIKAPALIIAGEKDPGARPEDARQLASGIPGARLYTIADVLHLCNVEAPHAFNEAVMGFLA